jgi:pimeloyl-ACP methyl ester carboxylesterase
MFSQMLQSFAGAVARSADHLVLRAQHRSVGDDAYVRTLDPAQRLARLRELEALYGDPALLSPTGFLVPPAPADPELRRVADGCFDARWPSAYAPWNPETVEPWMAADANRTAHARLFPSERPGPVVLFLHGYGAGHFGVEERLWPTAALRRQGWSVIFPALPLHGRRAVPGRALKPTFPGADPRLVNEGFRQATHDLRALIGWLRHQGYGPIGAWGMSLGGYTTALLATVEPDLAFAGLIIPLGSIADYAHRHGRLGQGAQAEAMHAALERVNAPISPYTRAPVLSPDRVRIVAARHDRITGVAQAERLGRHFGVEPTVCAGSHILQLGVRGAFRDLVRWMEGMV